MIQSYGLGFNAGQAMILEDVNGMCDRALPFRPTEVAMGGAMREVVDQVIGFVNPNQTLPTDGTGLTDGNLGSTDSER
jgi:hypothetical protein